MPGERILRDDGRAETRDELVDAVVDFGIDVIRAADQHDDAAAFLARLLDHRLALLADVGHVRVVGIVCRVAGVAHLAGGDIREMLLQNAGQFLGEHLAVVDTHVIVDEVDLAHGGHVRGDDLGIIRHDRAIIMVVAQMLVHVVAHAGVEDGLHALTDEIIDMAVHQLRREADGIRRDGRLTGDIQLAAGERGNGHVKAQIGEQRMPERQQLVHVQAHRQADRAARGVFPAVVHDGEQLFLLISVEVQAALLLVAGNRAVAAIAADEPAAAAEVVDRQAAVVFAQAAARLLDVVGEAVQRVEAEHGAFARVQRALLFGVQRRAVSAHQARDIRTDHVHAQLVFKRAEHRVVEERAALHDDMLAKLLRAGAADDLVQRVLDDRDGQAGGNIGHVRAVLLRLLDGGIHEHRAAGAEIDRLARGQTQLGEILDLIAQRAGERLKERAAAGGAGLVEEDVVDDAVVNLEAFDILPADVDDEIDVGHERARGGEVRHGFDQTEIHAERAADQILAVAGDRARADDPIRVLGAQIGQEAAHMRHGVAAVALVAGQQQLAVGGDDDGFDGRRAGVDAQIHVAGVRRRVAALDLRPGVARAEGGQFVFILEERRQGVVALRAVEGFDGFQTVAEQHRLGRLMRRAERDEVQRILRAYAGEVQRLVKAGAKLAHEGQRAAEIDDVALDRAALRQTGDGLVDHGHEDGTRHIRARRALIEQGLHVRLGEHAAAGGDGIGALRLFGLFVHLRRGYAQQRGHLVDERAGAARAGAVHAHLERALQEEDFRILAAKLDDHVCAGHEHIRRDFGGVNLLHEGDMRAERQTHARRAGNAQADGRAVHDLAVKAREQLARLLRDEGEMAFVTGINDLVGLVQHDALDGGRADIQTDAKGFGHNENVLSVVTYMKPYCARKRANTGYACVKQLFST